MDSLFGIPIGTLTTYLTVILAIALALTAVIALRNPVVLKMATRNIPRRRAQSALIVLGLMLATLLFSASFATGDTLAHSIRVQALAAIGQVDEVVFSDELDASGGPSFIPEDTASAVRDALADAPVDGVTPSISLNVPAIAVVSQRSEPRLGVQGFDPAQMAGFDRYLDEDGNELDLGSLGLGEAYFSTDAAHELGANAGDQIALFFEETPVTISVAGVFDKGGNGRDSAAAVMLLGDLQEILGEQGNINVIGISNDGDLIAGETHTDAVLDALADLLDKRALGVDDIKRDILEIADQQGSSFASIFLLFGSFSIMAGILLISLIFVMLAAERKRELGIARAVGAQRGHIVRLFMFEGAAYSLAAAAVGSFLGVVVGLVMVRVLAAALGSFDLDIVFSFRWQSLLLAYSLGMVVTYLVVIVSAVRVSSLNIVRAVRDIPEPPNKGHRLRESWTAPFASYVNGARALMRGRVDHTLRFWLISAGCSWIKLAWALFLSGYLMVLLGILLVNAGIGQEELGVFYIGLSFLVIGVPLLLKHAVRLPERAAYTAAGVLLVILWIVPWDWGSFGLPQFNQGIELFVLSGVTLVVGAVWVVMYNSAYLVSAATVLMGRGSTFGPITRTATAYPMHSRFRTGMTLAMFSLVIFTLAVVGFINAAFSAAFEDTKTIWGNFDITSSVSFTNPIDDLRTRIEESPALDTADFAAIGSTGGLPVRIRQQGTEQELRDWFVSSVDAEYANATTYAFVLKDERYAEDSDVWRALVEEEDVVVVNSLIVPASGDFTLGEVDVFQMEGFKRDGETLPEVYLEVYDSAEERMVSLRVIGIIEERAFYARTIITGHETLQQLSPIDLPFLGYQIVLRDPSQASELVIALEDEFVEHGFRADSTKMLVQRDSAINFTFNRLIQGFMGLGLIVGIAALGVIAARAVVERRVQIGVLRAIGFRAGMVQLSFLIESSFIALLGIVIGLGLGFGLAAGIINEIGEAFPGVSYRIPWFTIVMVVIVAYGASLLMTYLPARQASRIYPAEALRYDE